MTIQRMEHVGIVVDDLAAATALLVELALKPQGESRSRAVGWTAPLGSRVWRRSQYWRPGRRRTALQVVPPRPRLLRVALRHLAFVGGKCSENLPLLPLGDVEEVKRSPKFSRNLVELGGRDLQLAMSFLQAERRAA
jgi:hypothetical protein